MTHIIRTSREVLGLDQFGRKKEDPYANRKYLYIFKSPVNDTYNVVNYDACNAYLNSFMCLFDVWSDRINKGGLHQLSDNGNTSEVWFEVSNDFVEMLNNPEMKRAIKKFGVEVVYKYPFEKE
jgi:hypothetical protein